MPERARRAPPRPRLRELGITLGRLPTGPLNAITDVAGVAVGHSTIIRGSGPLVPGRGPVRTGVTAILPNRNRVFVDRVVGGAFILNGAGEVSGLTQVVEWGLIETPILLTNTLSVGTCSEAAVRYMVERWPGIGAEHDVVIPLVGECDDSWLNDAAGHHVRDRHVFEAIGNAVQGPVPEGSVGGGTGMITCDLKGGIGTSSRVLAPQDGGFTVGVLVMSNFGRLTDLRIDGVPVGELLEQHFAALEKRRVNYGSIIVVLGTDAPLSSQQLARLSKRAALGVGRCGSFAAHNSGEIVVAFSTGNLVPRDALIAMAELRLLPDTRIDPLYRATIEATEEAIVNALCAAGPMDGVNGHHAPALPVDKLVQLLQRYRPRRGADGALADPDSAG